jgi:hypothetical protein
MVYNSSHPSSREGRGGIFPILSISTTVPDTSAASIGGGDKHFRLGTNFRLFWAKRLQWGPFLDCGSENMMVTALQTGQSSLQHRMYKLTLPSDTLCTVNLTRNVGKLQHKLTWLRCRRVCINPDPGLRIRVTLMRIRIPLSL